MANNFYELKFSNGEILCRKVKVAKSFSDRLIGLMFTEVMVDYDGLLITPCRSIHTFFMKMDIDVIFLDKNFRVIHTIYGLKPWRLTGFFVNAHHVLEMKAGSLRKDILIGEELRGYV